MRSIAVVGNCHVHGLASALTALTGVQASAIRLGYIKSEKMTVAEIASRSDLVIALKGGVDQRFVGLCDMITYPAVNFQGFHPDDVIIDRFTSPMAHNHSAIVLWAFLNDLSIDTTIKIFTEEAFEELGYFELWQEAREFVLRDAADCGLELDAAFSRWNASGIFMHLPMHPKIAVLTDLARMLAVKAGLPLIDPYPTVDDVLGRIGSWPVYPPIADRLGFSTGSYEFQLKPYSGDLADFVEKSFASYSVARAELSCDRLQNGRYDLLRRHIRHTGVRHTRVRNTPRQRSHSANPYRSLPGHHFWKRSVAEVDPAEIDPVVAPRFQIDRQTKVATAGSCFAQHISQRLRTSGYTYFTTEGLPTTAIFSARYGNIYTVRQLLQLLRRAYGEFTPHDVAYQTSEEGRYIDPFRPEIEPDGFASIDAVMADRETHLAAVRRMFEEMDVFVFTLGLTEAWRSKIDGAVFPVAPGVVSGCIEPENYEFVNFTIDEVRSDLFAFLDELRPRAKPNLRVLLTVSPVPLVATYADRHVLVSTTYSKSVLRVAADECVNRYLWVDYLPSYEIITGQAARGEYFEPDLRSVRPAGVAHVMRVFFKHYATDSGAKSIFGDELATVANMQCEEEMLAGD